MQASYCKAAIQPGGSKDRYRVDCWQTRTTANEYLRFAALAHQVCRSVADRSQPRPPVHGYLPDDSFWPICDCRRLPQNRQPLTLELRPRDRRSRTRWRNAVERTLNHLLCPRFSPCESQQILNGFVSDCKLIKFIVVCIDLTQMLSQIAIKNLFKVSTASKRIKV